MESLDDWTNNLDSKLDSFVAHIDFTLAFDSVPLPKLMIYVRCGTNFRIRVYNVSFKEVGYRPIRERLVI